MFNKETISTKTPTLIDLVSLQTPDLEAWEDSNNAWDEELADDLSWEAENAIKDKRRQERAQRLREHQKKKIERDAQRLSRKDSGHISAVKLS